jgi:hypothetical protein
MALKDKVRIAGKVARTLASKPLKSRRVLGRLPESVRGYTFAQNWSSRATANPAPEADLPNPLREYFDAHRTGRGIWKWSHYFEIYHRHFSKFIGQEVHVVEIGIFSGGSLDMWKHYFGPRCYVYGIDIQPACKKYEGDRTKIFIGDQADRAFWRSFRDAVPVVDIVIDDGGHVPEQQIVSLEEMLPHIRLGGVYLCEDIQVVQEGFAAHVFGVADSLNAASATGEPSAFQREIHSVHLYPYVAVIEKCARPREPFSLPRHGTQWEPFL